MKKKVEQVEWQDVQGLVLSGYPQLQHAAYIPWRFVPPVEDSKAWLKGLIERLMRADQTEPSSAPSRPERPTSLKMLKMQREKADPAAHIWVVNVALAKTGLQKLGVGEKELARFSAEFIEGMAPEPVADKYALKQQKPPIPRRCNVLGDIGKNSPQHWDWGGWNDDREIDGMLLLYAASAASLDELIAQEKGEMRGVEPLARRRTRRTRSTRRTGTAGTELILKGRIYDNLKEHFGFRDGISQPIIEGTSEASGKSRKERRVMVVKPGEFVLGYLGERGDRVGYASASDPEAAMKAGSRDLARNGSYLVFRQLEQKVRAFRLAVARTARRVHGKNDLESREWVAARLIGRKQNGDPLIPPATDVPSKTPRNDFLYYFEDRFGLACPLGAHIRRANPRDLVGPDPDTALRLSKMHRIIRRGRLYGERLPETEHGEPADDQNQVRGERPDGKELPEAPKGEAIDVQNQQRGILFICLNANIAGQFELIQHSWVNNGRFAGLHSESDPVMHYPGENRVLTIQRRPTSDPVDGLEQFVFVRGGAYFFLPGIKALQSLT
jgi:Dyp-type peroxidase family